MTAPLSYAMKLTLRDIADAHPGPSGWSRAYDHDQTQVNALVRRGLVERDGLWHVRLTKRGRDEAQQQGVKA